LLLVGETGVGKTTAVQFLAERPGRRLRVVNLNQQSDRGDLFVEGALTEVVRQGDWILLDEVNMASSETLNCLAGLLESGGGLLLQEASETSAVTRHPGFRLLAAMNPVTNAGIADLGPCIRNRFTEVVVDEMTRAADPGGPGAARPAGRHHN